MSKKNVTVVLGNTDTDYGTLEDLEKLIGEATRRAIAEGVHNLRFECTKEYGYYNDVSVSFTILGSRLETDEEEQLREGQEQIEEERNRQRFQHQIHQLRKADKKKLYEQLKKEFEQ